MSRARPSLWNWCTHTTIVPTLTWSRVQEGINLLLLSHRAWHSLERSLFTESLHSKIKLLPSALSPFASCHKADDYQLEPALLQRSTSASQRATKISTVWIWKLLTSCRLQVLSFDSVKSTCSLFTWLHWHLMLYNSLWNLMHNYILCERSLYSFTVYRQTKCHSEDGLCCVL